MRNVLVVSYDDCVQKKDMLYSANGELTSAICQGSEQVELSPK